MVMGLEDNLQMKRMKDQCPEQNDIAFRKFYRDYVQVVL